MPHGWPFFAPSGPDALAEALDLSGIGPGQHLVDLGCGNGRVLVEAGRRGALVTGVESDWRLAQEAQEALVRADMEDRGRVLVADLFDDAVWSTFAHADVLFSYLSPALMQRLTPRLRGVVGQPRLVTVDFEVPDLRVDELRGAARLYRLPGRSRPARPDAVGWTGSAGTLCVMPTEISSLTCLRAVHAGGDVRVALAGGLIRHAAVLGGTDRTGRGRQVAVDIRWRERPAGTLAQGEVRIEGLPPHPLVVLFADADNDEWDLSKDGLRALRFRLRQRSLPRPTTAQELLDAAEN